jgi:hypothetical protein
VQVRDDLVGFAPFSIPFDRRHHSVQHVLVAKRFGQEIDRSALHGPDGHRNVAMASHEDDWNVNVRLGKFGLKVQPAQSGQPDVKDQAAGDVWKLALQHLGPTPVFGLISIIATAEKDRAKKDASLSRVNSGGRGRQSTYADTRRCGARHMGRQRQIP